MEKILIAIDSRDLEINAVRFACHLARLTGSKLTAIFLEDSKTRRNLAFDAIGQQDLEASLTLLEAQLEAETIPILRQKNIDLFHKLTREEGVTATVHLDKGNPTLDIVSESLFADILIVSGSMFAGISDDAPSGFVRTVIHDAGCPVIVAPQSFDYIDDILFCYDGGRSSIFAMKQFAYLFPQLRTQRAKVIDLRPDNTPSIADTRITGWLKTHFADVEWLARGPKTSAALFNFLREKADDFIVMGAYGKGLLSSFFAEDDDPDAPKITRIPIFIANH